MREVWRVWQKAGASLALFDSGIALKGAVAGVAMGLEDRDLAATFAKVVDAMTPEQKARYEAVMAEREVADAVNN